MLKQKKTIQ